MNFDIAVLLNNTLRWLSYIAWLLRFIKIGNWAIEFDINSTAAKNADIVDSSASSKKLPNKTDVAEFWTDKFSLLCSVFFLKLNDNELFYYFFYPKYENHFWY